jgi:hypothetical protein
LNRPVVAPVVFITNQLQVVLVNLVVLVVVEL